MFHNIALCIDLCFFTQVSNHSSNVLYTFKVVNIYVIILVFYSVPLHIKSFS